MLGFMREDNRPPEVKAAAEKILVAASVLGDVYFFRCKECDASGIDSDFIHKDGCKTGETLEGYRLTIPWWMKRSRT